MKKNIFKLFALVALFAGIAMTSCTKEGDDEGSATIVYTDLESNPIVVPMFDSYDLKIFTNEDFGFQNYGMEESFLALYNQGSGAVATEGEWRGQLTPLEEGTEVGSTSGFKMWDGQATFLEICSDYGTPYTAWNNKTAYIGFVIAKDGQPHYGWIKMKVTVSNNEPTFTIYGYAYDSTPNQAIKCGQKGSK